MSMLFLWEEMGGGNKQLLCLCVLTTNKRVRRHTKTSIPTTTQTYHHPHSNTLTIWLSKNAHDDGIVTHIATAMQPALHTKSDRALQHTATNHNTHCNKSCNKHCNTLQHTATQCGSHCTTHCNTRILMTYQGPTC